VAATRNFTLNVERASYGNFVARGTSKWRTNYVADIGANLEIDGLIVVQDTSPGELQFDDLFTYLVAGTQLTVVFTLKTNTPGEKSFIYTCEALLTALTTANPQFGESTWNATLLVTGAVVQTVGTVA
jgi:hypothetical protein